MHCPPPPQQQQLPPPHTHTHACTPSPHTTHTQSGVQLTLWRNGDGVSGVRLGGEGPTGLLQQSLVHLVRLLLLPQVGTLVNVAHRGVVTGWPCSTKPYNTIPYHTVQYHTIPCYTIQNTTQYHTIQNHTMQYYIQYSTTQYQNIPYNTKCTTLLVMWVNLFASIECKETETFHRCDRLFAMSQIKQKSKIITIISKARSTLLRT